MIHSALVLTIRVAESNVTSDWGYFQQHRNDRFGSWSGTVMHLSQLAHVIIHNNTLFFLLLLIFSVCLFIRIFTIHSIRAIFNSLVFICGSYFNFRFLSTFSVSIFWSVLFLFQFGFRSFALRIDIRLRLDGEIESRYVINNIEKWLQQTSNKNRVKLDRRARKKNAMEIEEQKKLSLHGHDAGSIILSVNFCNSLHLLTEIIRCVFLLCPLLCLHFALFFLCILRNLPIAHDASFIIDWAPCKRQWTNLQFTWRIRSQSILHRLHFDWKCSESRD